MKKILLNIAKKIANDKINIKKNYKLFRIVEKAMSVNIIKREKYEDLTIELNERKIQIRIFNSKDIKNGMLIYIHGGGWVFGSKETCTKTCYELVNKTKKTVVFIDYRLAPEYPFPASFNDCYDVVKKIMNSLEENNLRNEKVCLIGDSAGGNLVAAVCTKAMRTKDFKIHKQILLYPALQGNYSDKTKYRSVIEKGKDYFLTQKNLQDFASLYVQDSKNLNNPFAFPLNVKMPFFFPKTLIITADNDPLRDEGKMYSRKLKMCFNKVKYYNLEGAMHGFFTNTLDKKNKEIAYKKIIEFLGDIDES